MKELNRCTSATRKRANNMKAIIDNMRVSGSMRRDDISLFLCMSPSGGRKYIQELAADEIIQIVGFEEVMKNGQPGAPTYALNKDAAVVDAYLLKLATMPQNLTERRAQVDHTSAGPRMQKVQAEDGRQVHMLRDDVEHKPRSVRFKIPAPDPVLAHFYGFAGVEAMCG